MLLGGGSRVGVRGGPRFHNGFSFGLVFAASRLFPPWLSSSSSPSTKGSVVVLLFVWSFGLVGAADGGPLSVLGVISDRVLLKLSGSSIACR